MLIPLKFPSGTFEGRAQTRTGTLPCPKPLVFTAVRLQYTVKCLRISPNVRLEFCVSVHYILLGRYNQDRATKSGTSTLIWRVNEEDNKCKIVCTLFTICIQYFFVTIHSVYLWQNRNKPFIMVNSAGGTDWLLQREVT